MSNKIIGGEFEILNPHSKEITPPFLENLNIYSYCSGRSALYNICISPAFIGKEILLPDYLCVSIPETLKKAGKKFAFYSLDDNLEPDLEDCKSKVGDNAALLIVNYFGCINTSKVVKLLKDEFPSLIIILDNVQCPFDIFLPSDADYVFTSFRKAYPVADGAYVVTKDANLNQPTKQSKFAQYKLAAGLLKENRDKDYYEDNIYLSLFHQGEDFIDNDLDADMSCHAKKVMQELEVHRLKILRQRNSACILNGLHDLGIRTILPVKEEYTPLFIPIWLADRDKVRKKMFDKHIFCPVHWPLEGMKLKTGAEMDKHEMSIIIDQRYTNKDMNFILSTLQKALK